MGRAPCCDKANVKKGPWSAEEDAKLKSHIEKHGTGGNWIALPQKIGLKRCGKSCRLRWLNYLRPNIKHGGFFEEEDNLICSLYISIGSRWSIIAAQLPGRTDNDIKNYWNTKLKKKLLGDQRKERINKRRSGNSLKQETEKGIVGGSDNLTRVDNISVANYDISSQMMPYCPVMPSPTPTLLQQPSQYNNQEPVLDPTSFEDHNSITKRLMKLGGRFCEENHVLPGHLPAINDGSLLGNGSHDQPVSLNCIQSDVGLLPMLQAQRSDCHVSAGFSANNGYLQEGLEGLEFLSGDDLVANDNTRLLVGNNDSCEPVIGWDETNCFTHASNLMQGRGYGNNRGRMSWPDDHNSDDRLPCLSLGLSNSTLFSATSPNSDSFVKLDKVEEIEAAEAGIARKSWKRAMDVVGEGDSSPRKKLRLSKQHISVLEEYFKVNNTLNNKQKQDLGNKLNLRPRQVEVWFQNRRARTKLKQNEAECELLKKCCEILKEENERLEKELQSLKSMNPDNTAASMSMCPSC